MPVEPQVFDLLLYLINNRDRVVSKDDLIAGVWGGRIVSDSTLTSRINAARKAVADSGEHQQLIRTIPRKGLRFVGDVSEAGVTQAGAPTPTPQAVSHTPLPASGDQLLPRRRWREHRLCNCRRRAAAGENRQLADPSRIRLAEPDLATAPARACRGATAHPVRCARQWPI